MQIVKLDEGNGPVPVVRDAGGRLITRAQLVAAHARQEAEYQQAVELRKKLTDGDTTATAQIVEQVSGQMRQRLVALGRHKTEVECILGKLDAKDAKTVMDIVARTGRRLDHRVKLLGQARDRTAAVLAELDAATEG